ncbi:DUF1653 domain-containing protein [Novispirillum sp. DQ9]|uniref:DUF1653 domain-containing protein n=1 Tax=Novispirillum sp. DQ9 TaxID=3398612 RepID=UPI003C7CA7ED
MTLYRHLKRGTVYEVLHEDAKIEATQERAVVYRCTTDGTIWVRPHAEFFDGRFLSFGAWWNEVQAEAARRGVPHLLGSQADHRHGWEDGTSPADEVCHQIKAVDAADA